MFQYLLQKWCEKPLIRLNLVLNRKQRMAAKASAVKFASNIAENTSKSKREKRWNLVNQILWMDVKEKKEGRKTKTQIISDTQKPAKVQFI